METLIIINMDRSSLEYDTVMLLAKELDLDEEDIDIHMYNLWIDEKHTGFSQPETLQQLEDWFTRPDQNIMWQDARIILTIARYERDVLALRTVRAWLALKSGRIPRLYWLPSEMFDQAYREFVETNTHPGSVTLAVAPEITLIADRIVVKKTYTVALTAEAFVKGTLSVEVSPTCSEKEIENVALEQSGRVTWFYNGTVDGTERVERIEYTGDISEQLK